MTLVRRTVRTSDGLELAVVEFGGTGRPILLVHGLMGRATTWWAVARWLSAHGRVVGPDARGHGRSQAAGPWTTQRLVADLLDVVGQLALAPAVVIGHSMGGLHGWQLAAANPELVLGVVVEDMAPDYRGRSVQLVADWFGAMPTVFPSLAAVRDAFGWPWPSLGEYMAECVEERADGYHLLSRVQHAVAIAAEWAEHDYRDSLRAVRCPVLLIEGEQGNTPPGQLAEVAAQMPNARHVRVPGTGHLVHADAPQAYRTAVEQFLAELS